MVHCGGNHSTLVNFEQIMIVLMEQTTGRRLVSTMDVDQLASTENSTGYYLKESYAEEIAHYNFNAVKFMKCGRGRLVSEHFRVHMPVPE